MPEGTARDVGTIFWNIVADGGATRARFDHRQFPNIRNGARVTYTDANGDGIAENVQPAAAVARLVARNAQAGALNPAGQTRLREFIMKELGATTSETGAVRQNRLRRLRAAVDKFEA
jgi:hypothetical protein